MISRRTLLALFALLVAVPARAGDIGEIRCVQFSPNGRLAAFASNHSVKLWDTVARRKVGELKGHTDDVTAFVFAPDGKTLFTASGDKTVRQWDVSTGKELRTFAGPTDAVFCVAVSPDGRKLAAGGSDHIVYVWDTATGRQVRPFNGHTADVFCVAFSPDGKTVASGGNENTVRLWSVETGAPLRAFAGSTPGMWNMRVVLFTADGKCLFTSGSDPVVRLWDVTTGKEVRKYEGHQVGVLCAALSPDGRTLATGGRDATLRLWDVAAGRQQKAVECHAPGVLGVGFSPDGRTLLAGGYDCNVDLWETATGKQRLEYKPDTSPATKPPETLTTVQLDTLWKTLEGDDAAKAYDAITTLSARPQEAVPFLQTRLKASDVKVDSKQIQKWIKELDDEDFSTRENAQTELQKLGRTVLVPLQTALAKAKSVEVKRRLEDILKALEQNDLPARALLDTRALEVLENAHTPEARKLLETLASGTPEAELTTEAKAALARLTKRSH